LKAKIRTPVAVFALTLVSVASGASAEDATPTADVRALLKLESDWVAAEGRHDAATLRAILDDRFIATFGGGKPLDKEAFIKEETDGSPDPTVSQDLSDRFTVTYIKRGGRWLALAEQGARANP
jgi:hypothetical protein